MTTQLGIKPIPMDLNLTEGADFLSTLVSQEGAWPDGVEIAISVAGQRWTAEIDGAEARFNIDKDLVADAIAARPPKFMLLYKDGDAELAWGIGPVVVARA